MEVPLREEFFLTSTPQKNQALLQLGGFCTVYRLLHKNKMSRNISHKTSKEERLS